MWLCMLLMASQTAGPFGPKLSEVTAGTPAGLPIDGFLSVNPSKSMLLKDKKNC
jgi:hypothetical protein